MSRTFQCSVHPTGRFWSFFKSNFQDYILALSWADETLRIGIWQHNDTFRIKPSQKPAKNLGVHPPGSSMTRSTSPTGGLWAIFFWNFQDIMWWASWAGWNTQNWYWGQLKIWQILSRTPYYKGFVFSTYWENNSARERWNLIIPASLQDRVISWYHCYFQHPSHSSLQETTKSVKYWKIMHIPPSSRTNLADLAKNKRHSQNMIFYYQSCS